jgi:hypothetical protein
MWQRVVFYIHVEVSEGSVSSNFSEGQLSETLVPISTELRPHIPEDGSLNIQYVKSEVSYGCSSVGQKIKRINFLV